MSDVKLSDQLGAMAIIDSLYAQQIALEEHLDLPKLRQRIVQRIRDYYRSTGTDINDELIEQGVKTWFANRLRFQAPKMSLTQRAIAYLYLTSKRWLGGLAILILIAAAVLLINWVIAKAQLSGQEKHLASEIARSQKFTTQTQRLSAKLETMKATPLHYAQTLSQNMIANVENLLDELDAMQPEVIAPASGTAESIDKTKQQFSAEVELNRQRLPLLDKANTLVALWTQLEKQDTELATFAKDLEIDTYIQQAPSLRSDIDAAALALSQGKDYASALIQVASSKFEQEKTRRALYVELDKKEQQFAALPLSKSDRAEVDNVISNLRDFAAEQKLTNNIVSSYYQNAVIRLDSVYDLTRQSLTLQIVDRVGEKSGVERSYNESGGKSWYLIVEALTPTNTNYPTWVSNSETGTYELVKQFGQRVTQQEYDKMKHDKLKDGHIDNRIIGIKPANQLHFTYTRDVLGGQITNW